MGALDDLRSAGFSDTEVSDFATEKRQTLSAGGFNEKEINDYLGLKPEPSTQRANSALARNVSDALGKVQIAGEVAKEHTAPAGQTLKDMATIYGPVEAVLNAGTGLLLGFPAYVTGAIGGLSNKYLMNGQADPAHVAEVAQNILTYKPLSEPGRRLADNLMYPLHKFAEGARAVGEAVTGQLVRWNAPDNLAAASGAITDSALQMLGPILFGSFARRASGVTFTRDDVRASAERIVGEDAKPEVLDKVEDTLVDAYHDHGVDPVTIVEAAERHPELKAELGEGKANLAPYIEREMEAEAAAKAAEEQLAAAKEAPKEEEAPKSALPAGDVTMDEVKAVQDIPTVEKMRIAIERVGPDEFRRMADERLEAARPTDSRSMLIEATALDILGRMKREGTLAEYLKPERAEPRAAEPWEEPQDKGTPVEKLTLEHPQVRSMVERMAAEESGWAQIGGRLDVSRLAKATGQKVETDQPAGGLKLGTPAFTSWIPKAEWWRDRPVKLNEGQVQQAVAKALAGQRLSPKQAAMVDYMTSVAAERVRAMEDMGSEQWNAAAIGAHEAGLEPTTKNVQDVDAVARAAAYDAEAVERAALQYENDEPAFMAEIRRLNAEAEADQGGAAGGGGPQGGAGPGGEPVAQPREARAAGEPAGGPSAAPAAGEARQPGVEKNPAEEPAAEVLKRDQAKGAPAGSPAEQLRATRPEDPYQGVVDLHLGLTPGDLAKTAGAIGDAARAILERAKETKLGAAAADWTKEVVQDLQVKATPMAAGTNRARAIAKDFANADRLARYQWARFDKILKDSYTPEQRREMWEAAEEENVLRTMEIPEAERGGRGLARLTDEQRETMETLQEYGDRLLQRARDVGLFKGEGVEYWAPRMVALIAEDGEVTVPKREPGVDPSPYTSPQGGNITTSAASLKHRKYLTVEETEAAAKEAFGETAEVVRDIRTMPLAMSRIERAIAGRELINGIKELGKKTSQELTSESDGPGYFTVEHPSFKTYRPRFEEKDGKITVVTDAEGKPVMDRVPLYVSKEFEGPLKAIMSDKPGKIYNAFMTLKGKTMGVIMYSPLIHNAVEWGRALPAMPGKVLTFRVYFEGNAFKQEPASMARAIDNGLVPIGKWFNFQDISGIVQGDQIQPGRSWTAKLIGGGVGLANRAAGEAIKHGIDVAGDFWHNTLLWDRVGDLQAGIYKNVEADLITRGLEPQTAGRIAAHFANRFAGALPNESMSAAARKAANFFFFSRTFKFGNLGVMKDMFTGLPRDVAAQIERDAGETAAYAAKGISQRRAIEAFALDIALMYAMNSALQSGLDYVKRNYDLASIGHEYADRLGRLATQVRESPMELLNPIGLLDRATPQAENEPGKERRVFYDYDNQGTGVYVRLPTGKIGEEFIDWATSPLQILQRSEGTITRPIFQTLMNDKGFGRQIYDAEEPGFKGATRAVGNILWNFVSQQFPSDSIQSAVRIAKGYGDDVDAYKVIGPLFGVTFSRGAPGGPEVGEVYRAERRHRQLVAEAMPEVKELLKQGDEEGALRKMEKAGMTPSEMRVTLRLAAEPGSRLNRNALRRFMQQSTDEERERLNRQRELRAQRETGAQPEGEGE
jgi:hypothetical protein